MNPCVRALAAFLVVAPGAAWPCSPAEFKAYEAKGRTGLSLAVREESSTLTAPGGKAIWKHPISAFSVLFAADDSWIAFSPALGGNEVTIVRTRAGAAPHAVDVVKQLSEDEQSLLTVSSCGLEWFEGWEASPRGLIVSVSQNAQARPTEPRARGLRFLVSPDGEVSRLDAAEAIDLVAMAGTWQGPSSPERTALVRRIGGLSGTPTGRSQAAKLGPFIARVLAAKDADPAELYAVGRLVGLVDPAERPKLVALALASDGAAPATLWGLPQGKERRDLAERVFQERHRPGGVRATAVRVATGDGAEGYSPLLAAALVDPAVEVRDTAADNVARVRDCSEQLLGDVLAAYRREMETPTAEPKFSHARLVGYYSSTARQCMRNATEPSRHAQVAKALQDGLKLDPTDSSTPELYLQLVAWAEVASPARVEGLLAGAEFSARAQKYDYARDAVYRVVQWRVLRALRAKDQAGAVKLLAGFAPLGARAGTVRIPELKPEDVGTKWVVKGREMSVQDFIATVDPKARPPNPVKGKPKSKRR